MSVLRNFSDETEFPFVSISLDLSNKTHTVTVDSFSQVNKTDSEEGLRKPRPEYPITGLILLLLCPLPMQVTLSDHKHVHTNLLKHFLMLYRVYMQSIFIFINCKELWMCTNMLGKAEWESLPFIVRPLRDWYIICLTGLKQRPSHRTDWYTLILISVNRVRVRGMLSTKWRNSLLLPLALSTGRPGNSVDSNLVWRCSCVGD